MPTVVYVNGQRHDGCEPIVREEAVAEGVTRSVLYLRSRAHPSGVRVGIIKLRETYRTAQKFWTRGPLTDSEIVTERAIAASNARHRANTRGEWEEECD